MIYDILEGKLVAAGFIPGDTLFRNFMPAETVVGVMVRAPLSGIPINPFIPGFFRTKLQVISRHRDPVEGMLMAKQIAEVLKVDAVEAYPASVERGPAHITLFQPDTLPIQFPQMDGNAYEISQHFNAAFGFKEIAA